MPGQEVKSILIRYDVEEEEGEMIRMDTGSISCQRRI